MAKIDSYRRVFYREKTHEWGQKIVTKLFFRESTLHHGIVAPIYRIVWRILHQRLPPSAMTNLDPVVFRELPVIQKIISDETWLEGERRGGYVSPQDPVVQDRVCDIIMSIGGKLRETFQVQDAVQSCAVVVADHFRAA